jgi:hypothetical protein
MVAKSLLEQLKTLANKQNVPCQMLLKLFLLERVQAELHLESVKASWKAGGFFQFLAKSDVLQLVT